MGVPPYSFCLYTARGLYLKYSSDNLEKCAITLAHESNKWPVPPKPVAKPLESICLRNKRMIKICRILFSSVALSEGPSLLEPTAVELKGLKLYRIHSQEVIACISA
jgi:hypothetical protein